MQYEQDLENEQNDCESPHSYEKISEDIKGEDQIDSGFGSIGERDPDKEVYEYYKEEVTLPFNKDD